MDILWALLPPQFWLAALCIAFLAGLVKGVVGFALPLIFVSGLSIFTTPDLALAGLILPTLVTNIMQAFRFGVRSAITATGSFRLFLMAGFAALLLGALAVPFLPPKVYFLMLGVPIVGFILSQLLGWRPSRTQQSPMLDISLGGLAGFFGGIAGVWGPPTVAYLTALNTPKTVQMQVQGVIYLSGAVALAAAHSVSGILRSETLMFSAVLVGPAVLGMWVGTAVQDRIDQAVFRRATLIVLLIAGANLIRRGLLA